MARKAALGRTRLTFRTTAVCVSFRSHVPLAIPPFLSSASSRSVLGAITTGKCLPGTNFFCSRNEAQATKDRKNVLQRGVGISQPEQVEHGVMTNEPRSMRLPSLFRTS